MSRGAKAGGHVAQEQGVLALLHLAKDSAAVRKIIVNHCGVQSHLINISEQLREYRARSDHHTPPPDSTAIAPGIWCHGLGGAPGTEDHAQSFQRSPALRAAEVEAAAPPQQAFLPDYLPGLPPDYLLGQLAMEASQLAIEAPSVGTHESQPFLFTEPLAAGQSDALLGYLVARAQDQQDTQEPVHGGRAAHEQAYEPEEEDVMDVVVGAHSPERRSRSIGRKQKSKHKKHKEEEVEEPPRAGDTALIVKGINGMCQRGDVHTMLEAFGFAGTFDLLYMPKNFVSHQNRGYFHINFKEAAGAEKFVQMVHGSPSSSAMNHAIGKSNSKLVAYRARYQGLRSFVTDIVSGRKLRADNEDYRPWVYLSGSNGRPLTKEMAERLLSTELLSSGGVQSISSNVTAQ